MRAGAQVFVAGATGRLGARVVRELLEAGPGLRLRVGVRDPERAARDLRSAAAYGLVPADAARRVQLVTADVTRPDTLPDAIGNASKVPVQALTIDLVLDTHATFFIMMVPEQDSAA